jgi:hypothetical protein
MGGMASKRLLREQLGVCWLLTPVFGGAFVLVFLASQICPFFFWLPVKLWGFWLAFVGQSIFWGSLLGLARRLDPIHGLVQGAVSVALVLWFACGFLVWLAFLTGCLVGFYG